MLKRKFQLAVVADFLPGVLEKLPHVVVGKQRAALTMMLRRRPRARHRAAHTPAFGELRDGGDAAWQSPWNYYDDTGNLTESFLLSADGDLRGLSVPKGQWHTFEVFELSIIFMAQDGPWSPLAKENML